MPRGECESRGERTVRKGVFAKLGSLAYFVACLVLSGMVSTYVAARQIGIDWTMLGLAVMCLMPVLVILDLACLLVLGLTALPGDTEERERERKRRSSLLVRVSSLLIAHLVTAFVTMATLAVPPSSIFASGLTVASLRSYFVALASLSVFLSFALPGVLVNTLTPILQGRNKAAEKTPAKTPVKMTDSAD